jgi:hypothetical protein
MHAAVELSDTAQPKVVHKQPLHVTGGSMAARTPCEALNVAFRRDSECEQHESLLLCTCRHNATARFRHEVCWGTWRLQAFSLRS